MIIEGEEIKTENYVEVKTLKEIRPGRKLMCRKVTINGTSAHSGGDDDSQQKQQQHPTILFFIHGSCAASKQYNSLLQSISKLNNGQKHIICYLYDQLGCGESKHNSDDWDAFSSSQMGHDLNVICQSILETMHNDSSLYIVGHSYGVSQTIKLLKSIEKDNEKEEGDQSQSQSSNKLSRVGGAILISGGLKGCPVGGLSKDGGHWIFRYIPMFVLYKMQPLLSETFVKAAIHPANLSSLKEEALEISNGNDMAMCKAFYRQQTYADSEDAQSLKVSVVFIHSPLCHYFSRLRCLLARFIYYLCIRFWRGLI